MRDILKTIFVIIGTMIGAGFASGQEIYLFFNRYGTMGILGLIISCTLAGIIIYKVFQIVKNKKIHTYSEFLENISSNKKINKIMQIMIQGFLLVSFYIMVAGFSEYFNQEFGILIYIPAVIMAILCYITFINDTKGIVYINTILIPLLCAFIFYLGIKNLGFTNTYFENNIIINYQWGWLFSSILYASYNSILLIPILIELGNYMNEKNKIKKVSIWCAIILSVIGLILFFLLLKGINYAQNLELPMIQITKDFGNIHSIIYGIVILIAIFTTAISSGYGFLKSLPNKRYKVGTIIICLTSILVVPIGFSNLVNLLYPIFGVLGLVQIFKILRLKH